MSVAGAAKDIVPELDLARVDTLSRAAAPEATRLEEILAKARTLQGLTLEEAAALFAVTDPEAREQIFAAARGAKEAIYGRRMVLFAPLYASNECSNNCLYCAFRRENPDLVRHTLAMEEVAAEARAIESMGHKRILLLAGESSKAGVRYACDAVRTIYDTGEGNGEIRRVNVNMAPLKIDEFRALKDAGIGTFQCFQETYHPEQYRRLHPSGPKANYDWRLGVFDRCFAGGVDDVGMGVLFGLYDPRFDVLALLAHAAYLDQRYGVGPHTISFPRVEPAQNAPMAEHIPYPLADTDMPLFVAVLRLTVPYTGIIMSTRESPEMRRQLVGLGVSQLSAASRTYPGGYGDGRAHLEEEEQFALGDTRSVDEVIRQLCEDGYLPSFCTSCYRLGRTGKHFMNVAKPGEIQQFCTPNGLLTFQEYLMDYATAETRLAGERVIAQLLDEVSPSYVRWWKND